MGQLYTHGTWRVNEGREGEFVAAWTELAEWTASLFPSARGTLLQDRDDPRRFVSFGPWESEEVVARWRADPGFGERVTRMQELLESFEPRVMERVAGR